MLAVGQKLWFVPRERYLGAAREVEVLKVGRKWATTTSVRGYRVNIDTLIMDSEGYGGVGQCYVDREAYEEECRRDKAWDALRHRLGSWSARRHPGVTVDDIEAAAKLLRI